ncbi:MAG TPA: DUF262 domain-containing protein [Hydrogenophaga sp.]|uniref:GmrSD restriction endonuclease domain-containing protein n=1 Tax=Hydrogenophaga sp. TaxID=1904254 RepID=UPI002BA5561F|nr:DUF262 domain-containing protein [Hydrogenophaga sp.]HMN92805.1 DUF262 domain-containing protein [Hydrogenophaga sp.]HMP10354.1 DUF262 domain-containing protein [Hydrogenophaga sp.]
MSRYVNLDAMIPRADFAVLPDDSEQGLSADKFETVHLQSLGGDSLILPNLRKPDFQRETNHWSPEQVVQLIESFVDNELIPAVILWPSKQHLFVIDGGHRLSALRAWIEDDYGDKHISVQFFGPNISDSQKRAAQTTRRLVEKRIGSYQYLKGLLTANATPDSDSLRRASNMARRSLRVQWVEGNAEKAESSFYKINTQGTPLDSVEELLIKNRRKSTAIAARSIIRAGSGHKYWTRFSSEFKRDIEQNSKEVFSLLFEPDTQNPVKTLDLPFGGSAGIRSALELLISYVQFATRTQQGVIEIDKLHDDEDGSETVKALRQTLKLTSRITGNKDGSLGLHPAVYFYGPSGRHSPSLFMGIAFLIAEKLANNDVAFFRIFSKARGEMEPFIIANKRLLASIAQQTRSTKRVEVIAKLFETMIRKFANDEVMTREDLVSAAGLKSEVLLSENEVDHAAIRFSDDTKSATYIRQALASALKCPECSGFLHPSKSVSYDHKIRVADGGNGSDENCQLMHPYCNQTIKN